MLIWQGKIDNGLGKRFIITCWAMLAVTVAVANIWWNPEGVKGILLGGVIASLNAIGTFRDTKRIVKWKSPLVYYIGVITRLILIGIIIITFLKKFPGTFSIPGIFIGLSVVPMAFFMLVLQILLTKKEFEKREQAGGET